MSALRLAAATRVRVALESHDLEAAEAGVAELARIDRRDPAVLVDVLLVGLRRETIARGYRRMGIDLGLIAGSQ